MLENIPLAPLTTIKIGGPAKYFVEARTAGEVQEAVAFARSRDLPLFTLGGGSNLVVADAGWPGLVLKIAIQGIDQQSAHDEDGKILFDAGAGEFRKLRGLQARVMPQRGGLLPGCSRLSADKTAVRRSCCDRPLLF